MKRMDNNSSTANNASKDETKQLWCSRRTFTGELVRPDVFFQLYRFTRIMQRFVIKLSRCCKVILVLILRWQQFCQACYETVPLPQKWCCSRVALHVLWPQLL